MGMTIDEAIEYNKNLKMYMEINDKHDKYKFLEENHIALDMAIDTMRKYQKIQEIVTNNELEWGNTSVRANALWDVKKVVEDEKID